MHTNDTNTELLETETTRDAAAETPLAVDDKNEAETQAETAPKEAAMPQKRPRLTFGKKMVIYCAAWLILITVACGVMWNAMEQYEAAQPWYAVEEYLRTSASSAFYTALKNAYPDTENPYESVDAIAEKLYETYKETLTYSKLIREYTYENPVYLLQSEEQNLLKLTLSQGAETGFLGLCGYQVQSVELVASDLCALSSYGLVFPKDAEVYVNGEALREDTLSAESAFTVFGNDDFTACMLENFFARPTVKVIYNGAELPEDGSGDFIFNDPEQSLHPLTITAPADAIVRIDGKRVSDYYLTETAVSAPDAFGATVSLCTYFVPTVCGEPTLTATQDGVLLKSEQVGDSWSAYPATMSCTVIVPKDGVLYAEGTVVDQSLITNDNIPWVSAFDGVKNAPRANLYTLTDLYALPAFTAKIGETALVQMQDGEHIAFVAAADAALKDAYAEQAIDFMNAYLYYTTQGYSHTRANLDAVKAHVAFPSPLYTNLENSYIGYYYIAPQHMTVEYIQVDRFIPFGEDAFTCELSYKINLKNWVGETTEENTVLIAFARSGQGFAPVNMLLGEE